jgi:hypothetical protein
MMPFPQAAPPITLMLDFDGLGRHRTRYFRTRLAGHKHMRYATFAWFRDTLLILPLITARLGHSRAISAATRLQAADCASHFDGLLGFFMPLGPGHTDRSRERRLLLRYTAAARRRAAMTARRPQPRDTALSSRSALPRTYRTIANNSSP